MTTGELENHELYGDEKEWTEFNCEKCSRPVYLNENYIGLVLCEDCMDEVFPDD